MLAGPVNEFVFAQLEQQVELLSKQRIVVFEFKPKQWKRFGERTATGDNFRPALREQIQRGELLKTRAPDRRRFNTVTALVSRIFLVRVAAAARIIAGAESRYSRR